MTSWSFAAIYWSLSNLVSNSICSKACWMKWIVNAKMEWTFKSIFKSQKVALINENKLNSHYWRKKDGFCFNGEQHRNTIGCRLYWAFFRSQLREWIAEALRSERSILSESEKWKWSRSIVSGFLRPHGLYPTRLLHPWNFLGKSTGVGCHFLLQGIFLTQEDPWLRDLTWGSRIAGGGFTVWATREGPS